MENLIFYLGKVSLLVMIFFLSYYLLLRKETFFKANRWFLLLGIVTSLALPLFVFTKIIWVEPIVQEFSAPIENVSIIDFVPQEEPKFEINWFYVICSIYLAGIFFFLGRFTRDIVSLVKIIRHKKIEKHNCFKFIDTDKIQSPFSFFNYIIYNSSNFKDEELKNIIAHEKVHSSQYHSVDMLLGQLFCVFFWFNPFSWLHKKAIAQNLEFIADSEALKQVSDKITYQKTVLKVCAPDQCLSITNNFYQSLIKKRIVMLNKNQSKKRNSWKYATVLPLLTAFMLQFQVETVAQEKVSYSESSTYSDDVSLKEVDGVMILSTNTDQEITGFINQFKKDTKVSLNFSGIKRNDKNEITEISFAYDDFNGTSGTQKFTNAGKPIFGVLFEAKKDENGKTALKIIDLNGSIVKKGSYFHTNNDSLVVSKSKILKTDEPVLVVIDGVVKGMSDKYEFPEAETITSITVLKGDYALKKYGNDAKNGAMELFTKNALDNNGNSQKGEKSISWSTSYKTGSQEDSVNDILQNPEIDYKKALILIDDVESTPTDLEKLNPNQFGGSTMINGSENLAKKYGQKALNGLIIIETVDTNVILEATPQQIQDGKNFKINDDNDGFIIHKKSKKDDLEFYKTTLAKSDIDFNYSKIKRNGSDEITNILITLSHQKKGSIESISWKSELKNQVISDIFIGKRNGKLIVTDKK